MLRAFSNYQGNKLNRDDIPLLLQQLQNLINKAATPTLIFQPLSDGMSGFLSYKVNYKFSVFVLKCMPQDSVDISFISNIKMILSQTSGSGVSPKFFGQQSVQNYHVFISEFIEGENINYHTFGMHKMDLCKLLKQTHAITIPGIPQATSIYEKMVMAVDKYGILDQFLPYIEKAHQFQSLLDQLPIEQTLIHNDLHFGNLLLNTSDQLKFIDWDDAGMGDPLVDVVRLSVEARQTFSEGISLLENYLDAPPNEYQKYRFCLLQKLTYLYVTIFDLNVLKNREWQYLPPHDEINVNQLKLAFKAGEFDPNSESGKSKLIKMALQIFDEEAVQRPTKCLLSC